MKGIAITQLCLSLLFILCCSPLSLVTAEEMKPPENIMLISRIPSVMREGDIYKGGVAVLNISDRNLEIEIRGTVSGYENKELHLRTETLAAGEAREVVWDISVPKGIPGLSYEFAAQEREGIAGAALTVKQNVSEAVPLRIVSASLAQVETFFDVDMEQPKGAIAGRGGVTVTIMPRLAESLDAVETYMLHYPYSGLDQEISRAVALRDERLWEHIVRKLPAYLDEAGLARHHPTGQHGDIALTSNIIAIADEAGLTLPDGIKMRMEAGLKEVIAEQLPWLRKLTQTELLLSKLSALEALSRSGSIGAGSLPAPLTVESMPSSAVIDLINILRRIKSLPDREATIRKAEQTLSSRMVFMNRRLDFSTEKADLIPSRMVSADVNAARLLLACMEADDWKQEISNMVMGLLQRQHNGTWQTATANAWGVLAVMKYSRKFESPFISGKTGVAFAGIERHIDWAEDTSGLRLRFGWPERKEMLTIHHKGRGKPWAMVKSTAALPVQEPVSSGLRIEKLMIPVKQSQTGRWTKGDIARVRISIEAKSDIAWVVIHDPLPGGAEVLASGPEKRTFMNYSDENQALQLTPTHEFSSPEESQTYFEQLPKGIWSGEYLIRLQSSGTFGLPGTRVEALYLPGIFGELPYRSVTVSEGN